MSYKSNQRGAIGGIEGLAFGILIFAMGTLLVVNAWAVVNSKMIASTAAREATRTYVEGNGSETSRIASQQAATAVVASHGNFRTEATINSGLIYRRCEQVTATVRISVPRISIPLIGGAGGTFPVSASHIEVVDPYRSGLGSSSICGG